MPAARSHRPRQRRRHSRPLTPMIAFSSVMVTCLALSTAVATCCWCCGGAREMGQVRARGNGTGGIEKLKHYIKSQNTIASIFKSLRSASEKAAALTSWDKKGRTCAMMALSRLAISVCRGNWAISTRQKYCN